MPGKVPECLKCWCIVIASFSRQRTTLKTGTDPKSTAASAMHKLQCTSDTSATLTTGVRTLSLSLLKLQPLMACRVPPAKCALALLNMLQGCCISGFGRTTLNAKVAVAESTANRRNHLHVQLYKQLIHMLSGEDMPVCLDVVLKKKSRPRRSWFHCDAARRLPLTPSVVVVCWTVDVGKISCGSLHSNSAAALLHSNSAAPRATRSFAPEV